MLRIDHLSDDILAEVFFHLHGFHAVPAFAGMRQGRVFKMGELGLGYYMDTRAPCNGDALQFSSTCKQLRARILPMLLPLAKQRHVEAKKDMQNAQANHGQMASHNCDWAQRRQEQTQLLLTDAARFMRLCEIAASHHHS